ncbi:hypothetical protein [Clostridioides sp. ES-S-0010-02]|uniref:hypothetical protein n=1 Tax=Clostridioides sp. ES-S-0010-02 TaxID=2770776 RepID=UPI001D0F6A64|nr:hypothetical protein JJC01_14530 [Clostridioides sp. ES-S-0010-02]
MLRNNKGSILIIALIIFSIISTVCIMCIGLIYSNDNLFELEYKDAKLREVSLSGIEISISNVLCCVEEAINISNNEEEFRDYFLGNNMIDCIKKIKDISYSNLEEVHLKIENNTIYDKGDFFEFDITSTAREKDFLKVIKVSVKIKNPWVGVDIKDYTEADYSDKDFIETSDESKSFDQIELSTIFETDSKDFDNQNTNGEEEIDQEIIENIKKNFDEKNLVYIYKYRGV